jgi:hypothetical protein
MRPLVRPWGDVSPPLVFSLVAHLARRLGTAARLIARGGDGRLADVALAPLRVAGVELEGARRVPGEVAGIAVIVAQPGGVKSSSDAGIPECDAVTVCA